MIISGYNRRFTAEGQKRGWEIPDIATACSWELVSVLSLEIRRIFQGGLEVIISGEERITIPKAGGDGSSYPG